MILRYVQTNIMPVMFVPQACEEFGKEGWELVSVMPCGFVRINQVIATGKPQDVPGFVLLLRKELMDEEEATLPEITLKGGA